MYLENPNFGRGETAGVTGTSDQAHWEGKVAEFADLDYSVSGVKPTRSNKIVRCMCVRNVAAAALLPKRLVTLKASGLLILGQVDGYCTLSYQVNAFPVDEFLPAAGVAVNDLFWIVINGPAMCTTPLTGAEFNGSPAAGDWLVALTAASSGATTSGRVSIRNITGSSQATDYSFLFDQAVNKIGQALSAKTTSNTNADILVDIRPH